MDTPILEVTTAIAEWSTRALMHLQEVTNLTAMAAGASIHNALLRQRVAELEQQLAARDDGAELVEAALLKAALAEVDKLDAVVREFETHLHDRETRLAELSLDWEQQGARIMALERAISERPDACPVCDEDLTAPQSVTSMAPTLGRNEVMKTCQRCKVLSPMKANGKYCSTCRT